MRPDDARVETILSRHTDLGRAEDVANLGGQEVGDGRRRPTQTALKAGDGCALVTSSNSVMHAEMDTLPSVFIDLGLPGESAGKSTAQRAQKRDVPVAFYQRQERGCSPFDYHPRHGN